MDEIATTSPDNHYAQEGLLASESLAYFCHKYGSVQAGSGEWFPFRLWPKQVDVCDTLDTNRFVSVLKARQLGLSWIAVHEALQTALFKPGAKIGLFSLRENEAKDLLRRVKAVYNRLPDWLKPAQGIAVDAATELQFAHGSRILAFSTGSGDSYTFDLVIVDEADLVPDLDRMLRSVKPTIDAGGRIRLISRSNKKLPVSTFKRIYQAARKGENSYKAIFLPWNARPDRTQAWYDAEKKDALANTGSLDYVSEQYPTTDVEALAANTLDKRIPAEWLNQCYFEVPMLIGHKGPSINGLVIYKEPVFGRKYCIGCLPDGELVVTDRGMKQIEAVQQSDLLLDDNGKWTKILECFRRPHDGTLYEILPHYTTVATRLTAEHPVLVLADTRLHRDHGPAPYHNPKKQRYYRTGVVWKRADELKQSDIMRFPLPYQNILSDAEILQHFPDQSDIRIDRRIDSQIILQEDFWFLIGLWLAEGWLDNEGDENGDRWGRIQLVLNSKTERDIAEKVQEIVEKLLQRSFALRSRRSCFELSFNCQTFCRFIRENFGQKAHGKCIAEWIKYLPKNLKLRLFEGYWVGDGCFGNDSKNRSVFSCVSISERLLTDFQDILLSLGAISHLGVLREAKTHTFPNNKKCPTRKTFHLRLAARESADLLVKMGRPCDATFVRRRHTGYGWVDGDYLYLKIKSLSTQQYSGFVNNFKTESHTYCSRLMTLHNCDTSEGNPTSDDSSLTIGDLLTGEEVAMVRGKFQPSVLGSHAVDLSRYYNKAGILIERNNHGHAVILTISDHRDIHLIHGPDGKPGWVSTNKGNALLYSSCADAFRNHETIMHSFEAYTQLAAIEGATLAAPTGMHDDIADSYALMIQACLISADSRWVKPHPHKTPDAKPWLPGATRFGKDKKMFGL